MVSAVSEDDEETICMKPEVLVTTSSAEHGKLDEYSDSFMSSSIIGQAFLSYIFFFLILSLRYCKSLSTSSEDAQVQSYNPVHPVSG